MLPGSLRVLRALSRAASAKASRNSGFTKTVTATTYMALLLSDLRPLDRAEDQVGDGRDRVLVRLILRQLLPVRVGAEGVPALLHRLLALERDRVRQVRELGAGDGLAEEDGVE